MKWIRKYKLLIVAGILLALYFTGCSVDRSSRVKVNAESGILDLTGVRLDQDIVGLEGQWEFFWNRYVLPGETEAAGDRAYIQVPGSWNKFSGNPEQSGYGTAAYRLQILIPQETRLAFFVPRVHTAYEMWVNGELVAGAGAVGKNLEDSDPRYMPQIVLFESRAGVNEILINVSNFHHRSGGMLEPIQLGSEENILRLQTGGLARELILFGSLVTIGFYHLALYIFRKKNRSSLYFGPFSVLVGIRTLLVGQRFFPSCSRISVGRLPIKFRHCHIIWECPSS